MDKEQLANKVPGLGDMAAAWVGSQAVVSAYLSANVFDLHHAEDLLQETAKAVAEKFTTYDSSRPFTPWVMAIARNQLLKYYRTKSRDRLVLNEGALDALGNALERVEQESEERRLALRHCIGKIRGKQEKVFKLRYEENLKVKDIGSHLGIAASTVSAMLFQVRSSLELCIRKRLAEK